MDQFILRLLDDSYFHSYSLLNRNCDNFLPWSSFLFWFWVFLSYKKVFTWNQTLNWFKWTLFFLWRAWQHLILWILLSWLQRSSTFYYIMWFTYVEINFKPDIIYYLRRFLDCTLLKQPIIYFSNLLNLEGLKCIPFI